MKVKVKVRGLAESCASAKLERVSLYPPLSNLHMNIKLCCSAWSAIHGKTRETTYLQSSGGRETLWKSKTCNIFT